MGIWNVILLFVQEKNGTLTEDEARIFVDVLSDPLPLSIPSKRFLSQRLRLVEGRSGRPGNA